MYLYACIRNLCYVRECEHQDITDMGSDGVEHGQLEIHVEWPWSIVYPCTDEGSLQFAEHQLISLCWFWRTETMYARPTARLVLGMKCHQLSGDLGDWFKSSVEVPLFAAGKHLQAFFCCKCDNAKLWNRKIDMKLSDLEWVGVVRQIDI